MKIEIEESPYGDKGAVYDGALGMMQHFRLQLISFRNSCNDPYALEQDILGYEEVIASGSHANADAFLENKRDPDTYEDRFKTNMELVNWLKTNGKWESKNV